jgi:hypothetical protein
VNGSLGLGSDDGQTSVIISELSSSHGAKSVDVGDDMPTVDGTGPTMTVRPVLDDRRLADDLAFEEQRVLRWEV